MEAKSISETDWNKFRATYDVKLIEGWHSKGIRNKITTADFRALSNPFDKKMKHFMDINKRDNKF